MTVMVNKTYMAKTGQVQQKWWLVDANEKVVGRLASDIAMILMGKHRPTYTPHVDTGDFVIVINVEKIVFTGQKEGTKVYTWYTGYPGLRTETAEKRIEREPERILWRCRPPHASQKQTGRAACSTSSKFTSATSIRIRPNRPSPRNWRSSS